MSRRYDRDDPEGFVVPQESFDDLPLLNPAPWPEASPVTDSEQRGLPLPASLEERYAAWRDTNEGTAAFRWIAQHALEQVTAGATRLFIDRVWWTARQALGQSLNNSYRALLVRELIDTHPLLRGVFELRQRRAS